MRQVMLSYLTKLICPDCGAPIFSSGNEVWCSRQGSAETPGCSYGLTKMITVRDHLDRMNRQFMQAELVMDIPSIDAVSVDRDSIESNMEGSHNDYFDDR